MKLKNVLAFVMSMALVVPMVSTNLPVENTTVVSAEDEYYDDWECWDYDNDYVTEDGFIYVLSNDNSKVRIYENYPNINSLVGVKQESNWFYYSDVVNLVIPSEINGLPVTSLSFNGELSDPSIESIDKDGKITYDENSSWISFRYPYLETVQIPETMKYIREDAFESYATGFHKEDGTYDCSLKEVTILSKDVQIEDGFLCDYNYQTKENIPRDITLIGYVGSTTEEYAKKYGFKFVDVTTVTTSNNDNNNNPTIGDSNKNTNTNNNQNNSSSENKKSDSPATSDNGVMPLITLGTLVGASALITKKKKD